MTVKQFVTVALSTPTSGPGLYSVVTPGVTLTLETWTHWPHAGDDKIVVKDNTGSTAPGIVVAAPPGGTIDGQPLVVLVNPKEALIFRPLKDGLNYSVTG